MSAMSVNHAYGVRLTGPRGVSDSHSDEMGSLEARADGAISRNTLILEKHAHISSVFNHFFYISAHVYIYISIKLKGDAKRGRQYGLRRKAPGLPGARRRPGPGGEPSGPSIAILL